MSARLFITDNACDKFIKAFGKGTENRSVARTIITAMVGRSMVVHKTQGKDPHCRVSRDTRTNRRVFFVVTSDTKRKNREIIVTTLTQPQACSSFGLVYEKEKSPDK